MCQVRPQLVKKMLLNIPTVNPYAEFTFSIIRVESTKRAMIQRPFLDSRSKQRRYARKSTLIPITEHEGVWICLFQVAFGF